MGKFPKMDARTAAYNWATSATFGRSEEAPPKALGDLLESITGAIYVDSNYDLETAWKVWVCWSATAMCGCHQVAGRCGIPSWLYSACLG